MRVSAAVAVTVRDMVPTEATQPPPPARTRAAEADGTDGPRCWTAAQQQALRLNGEGRSMCLLGAAGTGKTAVIVQMLRAAKQ